MINGRKLQAGEWVEVRSKREILDTLDRHGQLDGLPFMPEMFAFCGQRLRVDKRAHKTCDTVSGEYKGRKMRSAVHLDGVRCDGQAHGGCEAGCLIFWKEAWLRRTTGPEVDLSAESPAESAGAVRGDPGSPCTEEVVACCARGLNQGAGEEPAYACQATNLLTATEPLAAWDVKQYIEDYTSGNVGLGRMASGFIYMGYKWLAVRVRGGRLLRALYDASAGMRGGFKYPRKRGVIPAGTPTPAVKLDVRPGDLVRVKSYEQILATCDTRNKNRGLKFDAEMVPFCGGTYRVLSRVTKILDEKTGKMLRMKNPCIILDGVACQARYSECRLFCPRGIYAYWREAWLERVEEAGVQSDDRGGQGGSASNRHSRNEK